MTNSIVGRKRGRTDFDKVSIGGTTVTASAAEINRVATLSTRVVNVTAATLAVTLAAHDSKTVTLNRAAGQAVTLPAASGSGARFRFFVGTTVTSNSTTIKVANSSDVMAGILTVLGSSVAAFATQSTSDTITLNGTTTGGVIGTWIDIEDVAANLWLVRGALSGSGSAATPFSATV